MTTNAIFLNPVFENFFCEKFAKFWTFSDFSQKLIVEAGNVSWRPLEHVGMDH
jgi:hypothetical protein